MNKTTILSIVILFILTAITPGYGISLKINWGNEPDEIGYYDPHRAPFDGQEPSMGPPSISVDKLGNIYIADRFNRCIKKFSITGKFIENVGPQDNKELFDYIGDIKVVNDILYFIDERANRVVKFNRLNQITFIGGPGKEEDCFLQPHFLEVDGSGRVYVGDLGKGKILIFNGDGTFYKCLEWNYNRFHVTDQGMILEIDYKEKEGYSVVERNPCNDKKKTLFSIGKDGLTEAFLVGIDKQDNITVSFSVPDKGENDFFTYDKEGKVIDNYQVIQSMSVRNSCVIPMGKIFYMEYNPLTAPKGHVSIGIR